MVIDFALSVDKPRAGVDLTSAADSAVPVGLTALNFHGAGAKRAICNTTRVALTIAANPVATIQEHQI